MTTVYIKMFEVFPSDSFIQVASTLIYKIRYLKDVPGLYRRKIGSYHGTRRFWNIQLKCALQQIPWQTPEVHSSNPRSTPLQPPELVWESRHFHTLQIWWTNLSATFYYKNWPQCSKCNHVLNLTWQNVILLHMMTFTSCSLLSLGYNEGRKTSREILMLHPKHLRQSGAALFQIKHRNRSINYIINFYL